MKKIFLPIIAIMFAISSCSKNDTPEQKNPEFEKIQPIEFSTKTLSFSDENELNKTIRDLTQMSIEDRNAWMKSHPGFTSQSQAANEITNLMGKCSILDQAVELKKNYENMFIFNDDISEGDFAAYLPTDKFWMSWVSNAYGDVEIGGKIVNVNNIKSFKETSIAKLMEESKFQTKGQSNSLNHTHSWTNSRKNWVEAKIINLVINGRVYSDVFLLFSAQQKVCAWVCWWDSYRNYFYVQKAGGYSGLYPSGIMYSIQNGTTYSTGNIGRGEGFSIGYKTSSYANASFYIWSQGVSEKVRMDVGL